MRLHKLLALLCAAIANTAVATTLNETVTSAVQYHPAVSSAQAEKQAAGFAIDAAKGNYLPQLSVSLSTGTQIANNTTIRSYQDDSNESWINSADVRLQQMIYDGGNTSNNVLSAEKRYVAAGHLETERVQDVMLEAVKAHIGVLKAQELVTLAQANLNAHKNYAEDIKERANNGVITKTDAYHADARQALAQASLSEMEENLLKAHIHYQEVTGSEPLKLKKDSTISFPFKKRAEAVEYALTHNPTIAEAFATSEAADAEYSRTKAAFRPNINFEVTSSVQDGSASSDLSPQNGQSHDTFAGLTMSWDIYRGGSDTAQQSAAASTMASTDALVKLSQRDIRESVASAWDSRKKLEERIPLLFDYSKAIHLVMRDYIDQFSVNRRGLLDLLDRQVESYRADTDLVTASYDYKIITFELLHATGKIQEQF
ncbi:TolC family outer membrane protein [Amphritea sp. HPY]|uniref:TolC family outer membrane protein n=1 Tax=Amphritea sp. HPY TaxID=3421652 RepID=UPI003D7D6F59